MQKGFIFDINKCTGCNACQIACSLENDVKLPLNWRQVITYNPARHPKISHFHLSVSCNHCFDPPCMNYCPALAIRKDPYIGTVIIDQKKCIGCQYCSWACPYDAPQFNPTIRVMEKCTLCAHRLAEGLLPACVSLCPTSALQFGDIEESPIDRVKGFTHSDIKPAIEIYSLRENQQLPEMRELPFDSSMVSSFRQTLLSLTSKKKITCISEWPLILFSLLAAAVISKLTADVLVFNSQSNLLYLIITLSGFGISTLHLGKILRSPRAILNWRRSWISREIFFYTGFMFVLFVITFIRRDLFWLGWFAVFAGFMMLFSIDKIYTVLPAVNSRRIHSSNIVLTGLFFTSLFSGFIFGVIIFGGIKFLLYTARRISDRDKSRIKVFGALLRILCGFIVPISLWFMQTDFPGWYASYILIGFAELIDRCEFYDELDIITPAKQMIIDLNNEVKDQ